MKQSLSRVFPLQISRTHLALFMNSSSGSEVVGRFSSVIVRLTLYSSLILSYLETHVTKQTARSYNVPILI